MHKKTIIKRLTDILGAYRLALLHANNFNNMSDEITDQINDLINNIANSKILK